MSAERARNRLSRATALGLATTFAASGVAAASESERDVDFENSLPQVRQEQFESTPTTIYEDPLVVEVPVIDSTLETALMDSSLDSEEQTAKVEIKEKNHFQRLTYREKGYVRQPDLRTCAAAASHGILNSIAQRDIGGPEYRWKFSKSNKDILNARLWMRRHDTLDPEGVGTDPNGWVKFLNKAWGGKDVYRIRAYEKKNKALIGLAKSIYNTGYAAGLFADGGSHAKYVTGIETKVEPSSPEFKASDIEFLYISDPLGQKNKKVTLEEFIQSRDFSRYDQPDSHKYGKPIYKRWYGDYTFLLADPKVVKELRDIN